MSNRVPCKFFALGACLKGEHCGFSHDQNNPTYKLCTFYQRGICSYGSHCRYEHVKASMLNSSSSSAPLQSQTTHSVALPSVSKNISSYVTGIPGESSSPQAGHTRPTTPAWSLESGRYDFFGTADVLQPDEHSICSFAATGNCPRGDKCTYIHGDLCATCGMHCLHPFKHEEREEHIKTCEKKKRQIDSLQRSQEIECSVCLERVLSKATPLERKFGLLMECDHPFCISCIRNWRSSSPTSGMDVNATLRACPICRKLSYFVVPSVIWYANPEEKQEIIDNYKAKLRSIDCKHFNFGDGNCPFGSGCFYKHTVKPGSYTWKYQKAPPRQPQSSRYNVMDMDELYDVFENLNSEDEVSSLDEEYITQMGIELLMMQMELESGESSSEEENYLF